MRLIKIAILTLLCACFTLRAQEKINIWEGTECKEKVRLTPYPAPGSGNRAVGVAVNPAVTNLKGNV